MLALLDLLGMLDKILDLDLVLSILVLNNGHAEDNE
jgi:hypothetical protein